MIIEELFKNGCIKMGEYKLRNGEISKYYFDMKKIVSYPKLLSKIGDEMYKHINNNCDLICGVPIGGLPIATYISTRYEIPMIVCRNEAKSYGTKNQIEGVYNKKNNCVIIEDVITTGSSVEKTIENLKDHVNIIGVIVIIDRQQGYISDYPVYPLFTKTELAVYRLNEISKRKNSRLCFSADVQNSEKLFQMLEEIGKHICVCKIHYDIFNDNDETIKNGLIRASIKHDFLLMEDRKLVDISYISEKQFSLFRNWVDMVTVMPTVNEDVIKRLSGVVIVANMSNNNWDYSEVARNLAIKNKSNVVGFVTQNRIHMDGMICMTPGIGLETTKIADQRYRNPKTIDTDIIIVGRGIYNYDNYLEKARAYSLV